MKPPTIPETPPPVLREDEIRRLLATTAGTAFDERRERAILMVLVDTGIRRAEIAGLEDIDDEHDVVVVTGKGSRPRVVLFGQKSGKARTVAWMRQAVAPGNLTNLERSSRTLPRIRPAPDRCSAEKRGEGS